MNNTQDNTSDLSPLQRSLLVIERLKSKIQDLENAKTEPIAIVGMACRFPGSANDPQKFWELLSNGVDGISEVPPDRWDINDYYHPQPGTPGKMYTYEAGCIQNTEYFDPQFFNISPAEAMTIDPQHRLLLEVSWEALENSGNIPERVEGSLTGVFVGISATEYGSIAREAKLDTKMGAYAVTGLPLYGSAGRLSYTFGLTGPSMAIDTSCSSSLVALHQACQSLRQKECNMALAGGVNLFLLPNGFIWLSQSRMSALDGRCKAFDENADGAGWGSGCGMLVLKRLSDAVSSNDNILAVIRGSALNQDGPSSGFTVPNSAAQQQVIRQALKNAKLNPSEVSYIEAHGTGTPLGDPIELRSLAEVFGEDTTRQEPLMIASVKSNIGHLASAAGISGVIKVILQLQHQQIVSHLHLKTLTSKFDWEKYPFRVPTQLMDWEVKEGHRIAGVNSFGASGTNAHIVLEEAPKIGQGEQDLERPLHILTLSAKTKTALSELVERYQQHLQNYTEQAMANVCYTANTGRLHLHHRLAITVSDRQELLNKLLHYQAGKHEGEMWSGHSQDEAKAAKIAFLFTGQGSQYINMGQHLYQTQPVFREAIDRCNEILHSELDYSLLSVLYPDSDHKESSLLDQTAYTQPALFSLEYALFQLWKSWGIKPNILIGHSVGEYVAATVAGVFSLEDALKLIAARGRLMQLLPGDGMMVAVMASEEEAKVAISGSKAVSLAAINGLKSVVISGAREAIAQICQGLDAKGIKTKPLKVSHAFHSPLMEPMLAEFEAIANQITYHVPKIPIISNITGKKADSSIATAKYWVNHVLQPVRFAQGMQTLHDGGYKIFLEVGPKPILLGMGQQYFSECFPQSGELWLSSLHPAIDEWQQILSSLGQLYIQGFKVNWLGFDRPYYRKKVVLPTYPFQRQPYWLETSESEHEKDSGMLNYLTKLAIHCFKNGQLEHFQETLKIVENMSQKEVEALIFQKKTENPILNSLVERNWQTLTQYLRKVEKMSDSEIQFLVSQ